MEDISDNDNKYEPGTDTYSSSADEVILEMYMLITRIISIHSMIQFIIARSFPFNLYTSSMTVICIKYVTTMYT